MLSRQHAIAIYDQSNRRVEPDRLTRTRHWEYVGHAEQMLHLYRSGPGQMRSQLHRAVQAILARDLSAPPRRADAFCKLLDDAATYERPSHRSAAELRGVVFELAAARHPLVTRPDRLFPSGEVEAKQQIAAALGSSWAEIDGRLFADMPESHRLEKFDGYDDGESLLARYNVAQLQAALYDAAQMTVWADRDFKTILRHAKLAGLMHSIRQLSNRAYRIRLDGPASLLRPTPRYGVALAQFLPALIACQAWRLHAILRPRQRRGNYRLEVSAADGLHSHLQAPREFDSGVESRFARDWGGARDGWRLTREAEILHHGQKVFLPDFVLQHEDGRRVLLEIVGFWTSAYLEAKALTLRAFCDHKILVAIAESNARQVPELAVDAITYRRWLKVDQVLQRLRTIRATR